MLSAVMVGSLTSTATAQTATPSTSPAASGVTVAIVDTGFDTTHEFFRRRDGSSAFTTEVCFDVCGAPVVTGPGQANAPTRRGLARRHGTHVAGVVVGAWSSTAPKRYDPRPEVDPAMSLIGVRVFSDRDSTIDTRRVARALTWLSDNRDTLDLGVVNISLGGGRASHWCSDDHPALQQAVSQLWDAGVVVVAGTGNDGFRSAMAIPACLRDVVSVAALDRRGQLASWSNRSPVTTIAAPGTDIWSAVPGVDARGRRSAVSVNSGTSSAAAMVTSTVARLRDAFPHATPNDIVSALRTARGRVQGIPVLDAEAALRALARVLIARHGDRHLIGDGPVAESDPVPVALERLRKFVPSPS